MFIKPVVNKIILPICLILGSSLFNTLSAEPFGQNRPTFKTKNDDYKRLMGVTAGVGQLQTDDKHEQATLVYANAYMFWFNISAEYQAYDNHSIANTYTGIGLGRYLQWQYGYGDEGYIIRLRSEFEVIGKFTVFVARERYRDKPVFDNYSAGIGYNF